MRIRPCVCLLRFLFTESPGTGLKSFSWGRKAGTKMKRSEKDQISSSVTHIKKSDIVNFIKIQRIKWAGQFVRMDKDHPTKKVFNVQPNGAWRKGRPNLRWIDVLEKDFLVLRTNNWRPLAGRRLAWKRLLEAKAHPGLSSH
ncbi:uncharacterized protein TNCV_5090571 [Trichonephila clavipes]|nr:uncharacterized protein TNCV_5090571 [Trichonephila clavipes]